MGPADQPRSSSLLQQLLSEWKKVIKKFTKICLWVNQPEKIWEKKINLFVNIVDVKIRKLRRRIYFALFGIFYVGRKKYSYYYCNENTKRWYRYWCNNTHSLYDIYDHTMVIVSLLHRWTWFHSSNQDSFIYCSRTSTQPMSTYTHFFSSFFLHFSLSSSSLFPLFFFILFLV